MNHKWFIVGMKKVLKLATIFLDDDGAVSNSTVVLFSRDHGGLGFLALKYHLKSNLLFTL